MSQPDDPGQNRRVAPEDATIELPALKRPTNRPPSQPASSRPASSPAGSRPTSTADEPPTIALPVMPFVPTASGPAAAWPTTEAPRSAGPRSDPPTVSDPSDEQPTTDLSNSGSGSAAQAAVGLGRASGIMALGTLASRVTGFLRTVAITAAIGTLLVGDSYNVANTTPNILYDLLLGGVLTSVVVPVLARASREDDDEGMAFASSLLTLVVVGLTVITLLGLLAAPLIIKLYVSRPDEAATATTFLRYFLPQVVFYGVGATVGAILNLRNRFAAPMATPVLNNLIVIVTAGIFMLTTTGAPTLQTLTSGQVALLGIGTTLGIVVMTVALLPSLHASGFRYRPRLDLRHPGLRTAGRLAGWVLFFVVTSQVSYFVVTRLATGGVAYTTWFNAYQLFQLPHAIVAVSVITALLPRMSRHAADDRLDLVRDDLSTGLRLASVVIVPAAFGLLALATPISVAIFAHGATSVGDAGRIGAALAAFAFALVPFSSFQLQLRAFYAMADSRTPAMVNLAVAGTNIVVALGLSAVLPERGRAVALALAFAAAYLVGTLLCVRLLHRRLDGLDRPRILHTAMRSALAGGAAALLAFLVAQGVLVLVGRGSAGSLLAVVVGGTVGVAGYGLLAYRMRIAELTSLVGQVRARIGR
ncbi:MAG: putative peptidoglycan lipid flippase [Frankiaceae bacterium]|nr:putative peptidoglycan lipid flippase [Frankiaceae bacterium]